MEKNRFFPEIHGNFGFGLMRLPTVGEAIDTDQVSAMVDAFLNAGFNYFDTAHGYHDGLSEQAVRRCLTSRYDRSRYLLTNKLTGPYFHSTEEIRTFFQQQLEWCGVDYFDFYLMHAQDARSYGKFKRYRAYETAFELKAEGKVRHVGLSFHDKPEVLERILTEYPQIEAVQIQFNYLDYESAAVESAAVYRVCEKFQKPVLVMEPVKGGSLVNLPADAQKVLDSLGGSCSNAGYALRFAASFPQVCMVLSGMSTIDQMRGNLADMEPFVPLSEKEQQAIELVRAVFDALHTVPCTACRYCVNDSHCPQSIRIPDLFACYNLKTAFHDWNQDYYYSTVTARGGKASDCIGCGSCEQVCPQHLPIRELLERVAAEFDKKK